MEYPYIHCPLQYRQLYPEFRHVVQELLYVGQLHAYEYGTQFAQDELSGPELDPNTQVCEFAHHPHPLVYRHVLHEVKVPHETWAV